MVRLALFLSFLLSSTVLAGGYSSIKRLNLLPNQLVNIQKDRPISDAMLSSDGAIWFTGKRYLWQWIPSLSSLKRIQINHHPKAEDHALKALATNGKQVFIAGDNSLYKVSFDPIKVVQFNRPGKINGKHVNFAGFGEENLWIHTTGLYNLDLLANRLTKKAPFKFLSSKDKVVISNEDKYFFFSKGRDLYQQTLTKVGKTAKKIATFSSPIKTLTLQGHKLTAHDHSRILKFDLKNKISQNIPVSQGRKLLLSYSNIYDHSYLFSDGLLEVIHLPSKNTDYYRIESEVSKTSQMIYQSPYLVLLQNQIPVVYKLSPRATNVAKN